MIPESDPVLVAYLGELLAGATEPVTFQILSDEEVAATDQTVDADFSVLPWLQAQEDVPADAFARFGERSLMLRGLVTLDVDDTTLDVSTQVSDALDLVIRARTTGVAMMRMTSITAGVRTGCLVTVQPDHGAVEEEIGLEGFHYFTGCTYTDVSSRLARWAVPIEDGPPLGGSTSVSLDDWPRWCVNELGVEARQVSYDLYLPDSDGEVAPRHWLLAHDDATAVLARFDASSAELQVEPITGSMLQDLVGQDVARAVGSTV